MDETEKRPFLSQYTDSRGKLRWRFRREGKTISLRGEPGDPEFEERYRAAIEGREPQIADIVRIPGAARPRSFGAAWNLVTKSAEWKAYDSATVHKNRRLSEMFLRSKVVPDANVVWRDVLVSDFKRRHAKTILSDNADKPHHAKHLLVAIRRMIRAALDEEWIEIDPTYGIKWAPKHVGWRAWTDDEMEKFEERWPLGSTPRLVYALGLWLGHRRSDLVRLKWTDVKEHTVELAQTQKTDRKMVLPITPMLREALDAAEKKGDTILFTQYGRPFSDKGITVRMRVWTKAANLPEGCTLHGLRKTLGRMLAESGASTRELMEVLGHDDIDHAELYSRDAEKALLAREGMAKVVQFRKKGS